MSQLSEAEQPLSAITNESTSHWSGVFAMALCAFVMVTAEFLPVSLLSPMAHDLAVSQGAIGQGISISGLFALITALCLSSITKGIDKRNVLLALTVIMLLSGLLVGLASNYYIYMLGRAFTGIALAGFWSLSASVAINMVAKSQVAKALAVINGGAALAMVIAAPLGSYLGATLGWRDAFLGVVPLAVIAFIWLLSCLPQLPASAEHTSITGVFKPLKDKSIIYGYTAIALFFTAQFSLYTYIRPFLETKTKVDENTLSFLLLWIGIAGFIGTSIISRFLNAHLYKTLLVIPIILAISAISLVVLGANFIATFVLLGVWGLVATSAPVGWWTWVSRAVKDTDAGGGLMVATSQLAIGLGSAMGGLFLEKFSITVTFTVGAALFVFCALMVCLCKKTPH